MPERISITGTSGGGTQTALIAALDPRIKVAVPSCYISSLPMRMASRYLWIQTAIPSRISPDIVRGASITRVFLLLLYPRPVMVASAVLDFFPIEGARKSFREAQGFSNAWATATASPCRRATTASILRRNQEAALDFLDRFNRMPIRRGLIAPKLLPTRICFVLALDR